ncbi:MAG: helicase-related protein [Patescibacteria group bacterium]
MYTPNKSIIDNDKIKLFTELKNILNDQPSNFDVATGYFNVGGFELVAQEIKNVKKFRLLLGKSPSVDDKLVPDLFEPVAFYKTNLKEDLENEEFTSKKSQAVKNLIAFLEKQDVEVKLLEKPFLHGKAYIFNDLAIIGSSNFTYSGLAGNTELNAVLIDPHPVYLKKEWFDKFWEQARDFKQELIEILKSSKLGTREYSPYEVYIKALYELQKKELEPTEAPRNERLPESVVDLATFQEDAVNRVYSSLTNYNGVLVADSVGLGKTWIAKKVIEDFGFYRRRKFLVICPASLHRMWQAELKDLGVSENIIHQEYLGGEGLDFEDLEKRHQIKFADISLIVIDESHNFRNPISNRYENLFSLIEKIRSFGKTPKVILMTATPMNNTIWDFYFQLMLIGQNNKRMFIKQGIFDLQKEFSKAQKGNTNHINDVLQSISIRRTRQYIRENYKDAKFKTETGEYKKIEFPDRKLEEVHYSLDKAYDGLYAEISRKIEADLTLAYYKLSEYKVSEKKDLVEVHRGQALAGIFQTVLLKRLESSVEAFRKSVKSHKEFLGEFKNVVQKGKILRKKFFLKYINSLDESIEDIDGLGDFGNSLEDIDLKDYDKEKMFADIDQDIKVFSTIYEDIKNIDESQDAKLIKFKEHLLKNLKEEKAVIFSYYSDTVKYVAQALDKDEDFKKKYGKKIAFITGANSSNERQTIIEDFLNGKTNVVISTDILSEGQNLQQAKTVTNYDLHWNPVRMIQRAGRIDRIGTPFKEIIIYNFYPEDELESLLDLVETLQKKIMMINDTIGLDASVLGEQINPKVFGIIRDLKSEEEETKDKTMELLEAEQFGGGELFFQPLKNFGLDKLPAFADGLPHGIQSGLKKGYRGIFFYFQYAEEYHFWYLYDLIDKEFKTNKTEILDFIACKQVERRVVPEDYDVYSAHDEVKNRIAELFNETRFEVEMRTPSGKKEKFLIDMRDELEHIKTEVLFEEDQKERTKIEEIVTKINEVNFTKKRLQYLRRSWQAYKKSHQNWRKLVAELGDFLADKVETPTEIIEEFNDKKLKLICVDYIS